jgi:glycyl-tRNA synthetase beta chain
MRRLDGQERMGRMSDFLLELRSEEIPARMQDKAREDLVRLFTAELAKAGITTGDLTTYATPRRLALIASGLPDETAAVSEETKGPRTSAPPQALEGFLRKTGLTQDQLVDRDGVYYAVIDKPGRATADVLAEAIPAIVRAFPWPKSMRWGDASASTESLRWVRPLHGIVALFGDAIVDVEVAGVRSGAATLGHRFMHSGPITIGGADDYVEKLHAARVIVDQDDRRALIRSRAEALAAEAGLELIPDEGLVAENAGLTEWPVPLLGRFDAAFLDVPPEVIQLTARVNQKYFVCRDADGKLPGSHQSNTLMGGLANAFICTANIEASDGGAKIVEGNRKVLAARLSDAKFFYDTDLKVPLEEQAKKLEQIVFHEKLGTVADKVDRVAKLARWLVEQGIVTEATHPRESRGPAAQQQSAEDGVSSQQPSQLDPGLRRGGTDGMSLADQAERAARLAKADLVTGMVGEFPELQGLMGGYYAAAQGEYPRVAAAIRDHYKPVGQGDEVPTDPVTVAVSLADKLDTLAAFFSIGQKPTGSKDPFALRRAGLAILALLDQNKFRLGLKSASEQAFSEVRNSLSIAHDTGVSADLHVRDFEDLFAFFVDRLKVQQREAGVRHDLIDAVFALGGEDDLVRLLARVHALQSFIGTDDGANLLAGYKRAANILKKEGYAPERGAAPKPLSYTPEEAEADLIAALDAAEPAAADAVAREGFEGAMAALASLRAPIDAFFDSVTVNAPDADKRAARLALLDRVRTAVHRVADFSRIEG